MNIEEYYQKYGPMVFRRCLRLLGNESKAEEAMQDTFVQVFLHRDRLKDQYPSSLLYRISTNICLNLLRGDEKKEEVQDDSILNEIIDSMNLESKMISKNFLTKLFSMDKETTALIAVLYYLDGMTLEEVAREVSMSVSGVRKCLKRIDEKMKVLEECS